MGKTCVEMDPDGKEVNAEYAKMWYEMVLKDITL